MALLAKSLARRTLGSELRALGMVARRSWLLFVRYPTWVLALIVWPVIFPAVYIIGARALAGPDGAGMAVFQQATGVENYMAYIAVGTTIWMWQNIVLWEVGTSLRGEQRRGTLEANWLTPTWRFSFLLGSSLTQLVSMTIFLIVSAIEFYVLFGLRFAGSPWLVLLVLLSGIPAIYGLGMAFASVVITAKEANAFVFLVRGLVMIFCGITFPVAILPAWMQATSRWIPPTYLIRAMRNAVLSGAGWQALLPDLLPLLGFGVIWLAIGYILFNHMERRARVTGAIGQY